MSTYHLDYMESKTWYTSKTVWLAILQAAAGILTAILSQDPDLQMVGGILLIKSGIDLGIRILTEKPLE